MDMYSPVVLVTDLDGTYLEADGELASTHDEFARSLEDRGIEFIVATNRSPHNVAQKFASHGSFYAVCSDGATTIKVTDGEWRVVAEAGLGAMASTRVSRAMLECATPRELFLFSSAERAFAVYHYTPDGSDESLRVFTENLGDPRPICRIDTIGAASDLLVDNGLLAVSWFAPKEQVEYGRARIQSLLNEEVSTRFYAETRIKIGAQEQTFWWLDILSLNANKGYALKKLWDLTAPDIPLVVALGDGDNDVSLFSVADLSYCPITASPAARESATHVLPYQGGGEFIRAVAERLLSDLALRRGGP